MKNNLIYAGRLLLFCVIQIFSVSLYAHSLAHNAMLYTNTHVVGLMPQSQIHGKITDSKGVPLAGVSIIVKGTQRGTTSDFNGGYTIDVNNNQVLVFSFVGFKTQEIPIHSRNELNVIMEPEVTSLDTIEINAGYYRVKDRERTGSIATLKAQTIDKQPVNNPLAAMQGHVSGVNVVQNTGVPGGGYNIEIRGKNFLNSGSDPLFIVDGVPYGSQSLGAVEVSVGINGANISPLNAINPNDIESIEVLKDADATEFMEQEAPMEWYL
ncbi:carboxypeptidase-like regulatory domain-containing protein [Yeosuana marina]|uniref:carboxypeptidase-like regulatory domain-containing protein n=1 Tax=Yeosuana marina TaxID=1565536 RepID=UPI0030C7DBE1